MPFRRGFWYSNESDYSASSHNRVEHRESSSGQRSLFVKDFVGSETILATVVNPMLVALDTPELKRKCYNCYEREEELVEPAARTTAPTDEVAKMRVCDDCELVRYCSEQCSQKAHESFHRYECSIFQSLSPRIPPSNLRAVLRLLLLRRGRTEFYRGDAWEQLLTCKSHVDSFRKAGGQRWEDLVAMTQCAIEFSKTTESFETVLGFFCKLLYYGIPLLTRQFEEIGLAMHPYLSDLRHSCQPNSIIRFDSLLKYGEHHIEIVPLHALDKDEEVTVAFVNPATPFPLRSKMIKQNYFFDCKCGKCANDKTELGSEFMTSDLLITYDKVAELVNAADTDTCLYLPIQRLRYALHLLLLPGWNATQHLLPMVLQKLVMAYVSDKQFNLAFAFAVGLKFRTDKKLYGQIKGKPAHPIRLANEFHLIRLADKVIDAEEWESQEISLADRGLNLVSLRSYWARQLIICVQRHPGGHFRSMVCIHCKKIRNVDRSAGDKLDDAEEKAEALAPVKELVNEVLEKVRREF